MKRLIFILLPLIAASCVKEIYVVPKEDDWEIVLNASFRTGKAVQQVYLSSSTALETTPLHGAAVTCETGGVQYNATEFTDYKDAHTAMYGIEGMVFAPGDVITLTASKDGRTAKAKITVPGRGAISDIKKLRTSDRIWFSATLTDPSSDEEWFGLQSVLRIQRGKNPVTEEDGTLRINARLDPILMDGKPAESETGSLLDEIINGIFGEDRILFSDRNFKGGKADVRFFSNVSDITMRLPAEPEEDENQRITGLKAVFTLTTYSKSHFRYIQASDVADLMSSIPEIMMFIEPVVLPANVTGGLGFVSATTVFETEIDLGELL